MKVVFLGYAVDNSLKNYSGMSVAGNQMQLNIIENMSKFVDVEVISIPPYSPDLRLSSLLIKKEKGVLFNRVPFTYIGFVNIPVLKQFIQTLKIVYLLSKLDRNQKIITFNLFPQIGVPFLIFKNRFDFYPYIADVPIDDSIKRGKISKLFRFFFDKITRHSLSSADNLIVINEKIITHYGLKSDYLVIEGGVNENRHFECVSDLKVHAKKHIVYTGTLNEYSGITNLISAMDLIKNKFDYILDIYGSGELEKDIIEQSIKNENIMYHGRVGHEKIKCIQANAYLLVNPRSIEDEIANLTFPSKIFEYMLSGRPILSTKISGLSNDYLGHIFLAKSNSPKDLATKIDEISMYTLLQLSDIGSNTRKFALENKNWQVQVGKIIDFIE